MLAKVSKDLIELGQTPVSYNDELTQDLCNQIFDSCQPEILNDCHYNTIIKIKGDNRFFIVNSIDFDFFETIHS